MSTISFYLKDQVDNIVSKKLTQLSSMPEASTDWQNIIIQYTGETTSEYIQGAFYICKYVIANNVKLTNDDTTGTVPSNILYSETMPPDTGFVNLYLDENLTQPVDFSAQSDLVYHGTVGEYRLDIANITSKEYVSVNKWKWVQTGVTSNWGTITGTLSDQTDLQNTLTDLQTDIDVKVPKTTKVATIDLEDDITVSELFTALKSSIVDMLYPVNSRYVQLAGMPEPSTFGGTWVVDTSYNGKALWVDSTKSLGTTIDAGLPNIKGSTVLQGNQGYDYSHDYFKLSKDCFSAEADKSIDELATQSSLKSSGVARNNNNTQKLVFDASTGQYDSTDTKQTGDDVVYGKADTVQPPAITVKVWIRTA